MIATRFASRIASPPPSATRNLSSKPMRRARKFVRAPQRRRAPPRYTSVPEAENPHALTANSNEAPRFVYSGKDRRSMPHLTPYIIRQGDVTPETQGAESVGGRLITFFVAGAGVALGVMAVGMITGLEPANPNAPLHQGTKSQVHDFSDVEFATAWPCNLLALTKSVDA